MRKSSEGHFKVFIVWLLKTNTTKEEFFKKANEINFPLLFVKPFLNQSNY